VNSPDFRGPNLPGAWRVRRFSERFGPGLCGQPKHGTREARQRDLEADPRPDIVVEIDISKTSERFPIYAALAVPEIWIYDGENVRFYELTQDQYIQSSQSRFFPNLEGEMLTEAIEVSKIRGQKTALDAFRRRIRSRKQ